VEEQRKQLEEMRRSGEQRAKMIEDRQRSFDETDKMFKKRKEMLDQMEARIKSVPYSLLSIPGILPWQDSLPTVVPER